MEEIRRSTPMCGVKEGSSCSARCFTIGAYLFLFFPIFQALKLLFFFLITINFLIKRQFYSFCTNHLKHIILICLKRQRYEKTGTSHKNDNIGHKRRTNWQQQQGKSVNTIQRTQQRMIFKKRNRVGV